MVESDSPGLKSRFGSFLIQCKRVWHILRKPTGDEFKAIAKVSAIGILIIGAVGFIIADILTLFGKYF